MEKKSGRIQGKKISPSALLALREALATVFWYKRDLRTFLTHSLIDSRILATLNWDAYKRNIVENLIDRMASQEDMFQESILTLMIDVSQIDDFTHLLVIDDGKKKAADAERSVKALRKQLSSMTDFQESQLRISALRDEARLVLTQTKQNQSDLSSLRSDYLNLVSGLLPHARGFALEKFFYKLFKHFDLDPKASFKLEGEQIDGAFSHDGTDYILESKWQSKLVGASQIHVLSGKVSARLKNTLGLFISINGYTTEGVEALSRVASKSTFLMDGYDLMAVLDGRVTLDSLLLRKRRAASQSGNIYLKITDII